MDYLIDKNNGCVLYKPFLSMLADEKAIKEHLKAEDYIIENGVSSKEYNKYLNWKYRLAFMGKDTSKITYKDFEYLQHFVKVNVNNWQSQVDYNEWNW